MSLELLSKFLHHALRLLLGLAFIVSFFAVFYGLLRLAALWPTLVLVVVWSCVISSAGMGLYLAWVIGRSLLDRDEP